jgi:hypothetical protein
MKLSLTEADRDKLTVTHRYNYNHMKSSMTKTSHSGMIIIARFHSLSRLVGMATEKQIINT